MFEIMGPAQLKIGSKIVDLPCNIKGYYKNDPRVLIYDNLVVVNFYPHFDSDVEKLEKAGIDTDTNIWAFDQDGNLVWQVQSFKSWVLEKYDSDHQGAAPYTYVSVQDGKLVGGNWAGSDLIIDPKTGKILGRYPDDIPRRPW